MTNYLQNLGLAEVIPVIFRQSCYSIHPNAVFSACSKAGKAFENLVKGLDLKVKPLSKTSSFQNRKRSASHSSGIKQRGDGPEKSTKPIFEETRSRAEKQLKNGNVNILPS